MRLTTTAQLLRDTISLAAVITPSTAQLAAYTGVLLEVTSGHLLVRGSDGDTAVTTRLKVDKGEAGSVLIQPGALLKYLDRLTPGQPVQLHAPSSTSLEVHTDGPAPYKFTAMTDSFPTTPTTRRDKVPADLSELAPAVDAVKDCAGTLTGGSDKVVQLVSNTDDGLKLHSTDRFRVARATLPPASGFGMFDGLLPLRVLTLVASIRPTHVQLDPKGRDMVFHGNDVVVSTRLAQDPFPVVDAVLAADTPYSAPLPQAETLAALRRLAAIATPNGPLALTVEGDHLRLTVSNAIQGSGTEEVTLAEPANADLEVRVNFDYFTSALRTQPGPDVRLSWAAPLKPVFLSSGKELPVTHAIMPMRD